MAVVEETIGSGKDRATVTLWEANVGTFGTDIYKGIIQESVEFNENVTLAGSTGTPSITSYLWLTTDPANRHSGVAGTGHGRMRGNTNGSHVLTVSADFTRIDWLEIQQDSTGNSNEGIRVTANVNDALISYCIVWTDQNVSDQDGIYMGNWLGQVSIDNCIIYGFNRANIHPQRYGTAGAQTWNVDHCTIVDGGATGEFETGAIHARSDSAGQNATINVYNTIGYLEYDAYEAFADGDGTTRGTPGGTVTWNGSNNLRGDQGTAAEIDGTDNTTSWQSATDGDAEVTKSTGSWVVFGDITAGTENFTLLDDAAGNLAAGNGTDRQESEPDARQDFSIDITGGARSTSTVDIGAHNVSAAAVAGTATAPLISRSFTVDAPTLVGPAVDVQDLVARSFTVDTAVAAGAAVDVQDVIARSFAVNTPTQLVGPGVPTPATTARSFTLDQVTPVAPATNTSGVIARVFAVDTATAAGAASATPSTIARPFGLPQVTPAGGGVDIQDLIARSFTVDAAVAVGAGVDVQDLIARSFGIGAPTLSGLGVDVQDLINRSFTVDAVTLSNTDAGGPTPGSATPSTVARAFTVDAVTLSGLGVQVVPVIELQFTVPPTYPDRDPTPYRVLIGMLRHW